MYFTESFIHDDCMITMMMIIIIINIIIVTLKKPNNIKQASYYNGTQYSLLPSSLIFVRYEKSENHVTKITMARAYLEFWSHQVLLVSCSSLKRFPESENCLKRFPEFENNF
jgi:hypothetical protein